MRRIRPEDWTPGDVREPRGIDAMEHSPPERSHHDPHARATRPPRAIPPAARNPASRHKQPRRHLHDAYWRRRKED